MKKQKKIIYFFAFMCLITFSYAMENDFDAYQKACDDAVKRIWIPKKEKAAEYMEQSLRSKNSVSLHGEEFTVGSFNGLWQQASVKIPDPKNEKKRIERVYPYEKFKKLLEEPLPDDEDEIDDGSNATENDHFIDKEEKEHKKCCCCFSCW